METTVASLQQFNGNRHEYRLKAWQRWFYLILGMLVGGIGVAGAFVAVTQPSQHVPLAPTLIPLAIGVYLVAYVLRSRLIIESTRVEVRGVFRQQSADLSEIEGFRTVSSRNSSFWQLQRKEGRGTISISQSFDGDDDLRAWFQQLTDLDERDRKSLLDDIAQQESLGSTPEERLGALERAKQWNIGISVFTVVAAAGFNFGPAAFRMPSAVILALAPVGVLFLLHREPLVYAIFKPKRDPRTDLGITFMAAGFGLLMGARGINFVSIRELMPLVLLISLACAAVLFAAVRKHSQPWGVMIGLIFFAGMYGYGVATAADSLPDRSKATSYVVTVTGKHRTHGRSTSYYLDLEPWGPIQEPNKVNVPFSTYRDAAPGDAVCLDLHAGALNLAWYERISCPMQPALQTAQ
jgi:hypothetical protein